MDFTNWLMQWYLQNKRDLPWRGIRDPYLIWLSEIILQQTRVAQGMPYYISFIKAFPTVFDLANASEDQILKLWQGLGYYSRARNLHQTARHVAFDLHGIFPDNHRDLLLLKGVGDYTAAAIASFCYGEAVPVVDGNVFRLLARYFDIQTDIANASAKKEFAALARALMPENDPATFNQAMMEFGAMQCIPKNPDCGICPLRPGCLALQKGIVNQLPVKSKKAPAKHRFFNYIVFSDDNHRTFIQKRAGKGIWQNLFEFPLIESATELDFDAFTANLFKVYGQYNIKGISELNAVSKIHKLTHQHLYIKFWKVEISGLLDGSTDAESLRQFAFPIVIFNFVEQHWQ